MSFIPICPWKLAISMLSAFISGLVTEESWNRAPAGSWAASHRPPTRLLSRAGGRWWLLQPGSGVFPITVTSCKRRLLSRPAAQLHSVIKTVLLMEHLIATL